MNINYAHSLLEAMMDSAILLDKGGRIVDWNQNATSLFGYSKKEVLGRSLNLIYAHNLPIPKIIHDILPSQKKWFEETAFIRKNGTKGFCKTCISTIIDPEQPKQLTLVTHQQITAYKTEIAELQNTVTAMTRELQEYRETILIAQRLAIRNLNIQKHTEKNLRESELRFHLLAENSTDIIARLTTDGTFLYLSVSCKSWLGFTPEELVGFNLFKLVHPEDESKVRKAFNRRKHPANHHTVTYRMRRKEGDYRWFESTIRLIRDEQKGFIKEIQSASRDVTERILDKKARLKGQQLAHVFRLSTMEEMASGMAHEISQPLAAIVNYTRGCVRHLEKGHDSTTQLTEIMEKAVAQAERAGEVIHRLKNFFCKGQLIKTTCAINSVIRETASFIRNELNLSKTKVDFELSKDLPLVSADKIQLQQVILNLMQNAIEAMKENEPRNRRIHIQTKPVDENTIEVRVSDSGPGFSKEIITKVFKPFFTTKAHGRGMGLAICRSIIEAHGGQFTINPNTNNHSWIRFTLPVV
ncbi:MAG: PAS domain S-box protein [Gammaproteobacteria bacterium]|nr:PAS domain S-box protein [Gammaproteobacteria bacterium]